MGVWFDPAVKRWHVYNEDQQPMLVNSSYNVTLVTSTWGGFTHTSTSSTVSGNSTTLNNANLNGQPNAQVIVTHNFKLGGGSAGIYHNKALGVWYDNTAQRWKAFNQDLSAMPVGITFNVMARP